MTQRQLNLLQSIEEGIQLAREEFTGPGGLAKMCDVLQDELFAEGQRRYSAGHIAYLACALIGWKDAGSPDFN